MVLNIDSWPEPTTDEEILAGWGEAVNQDLRDLAGGSVVPAGAEPVLHFAWDSAATVGLTFGVKAGVMWDGTTLNVKAPQTTALADNATNYVELNPASGVISDNVVGFTADMLPLFQVTTAGGVVTAILDRRAPYGFDGNGGGGGGGSGQLRVYANNGAAASAALISQLISYPTEIVDANGEWNGTRYTSDADGLIDLDMSLVVLPHSSNSWTIQLFKNGVLERTLYSSVSVGSSNAYKRTVRASATINLTTGDYLELYFKLDTVTGGVPQIYGSFVTNVGETAGGVNWITIKRH